MAREISDVHPHFEVRLLGINGAAAASGNPQMVQGRTLPWLQDTENGSVWISWHVTWRDVVVLNSENHRVAVFNLTQHDLRRPAAYDSLKTILLDVAGR
jgi:hypothetical protein